MLKDIKLLGKQTVIYGIGLLLNKGIGFFMIPLYTHYLSPTDYGTMEMLDLTGNILGVVFAMGISNSILRFYSYFETEAEREDVINTALIFALISGTAFVLIMISCSSFVSQIVFRSKEYSVYFPLVFTGSYLTLMLTHCMTVFRAKGKPKQFIFVSFISTLLSIAFNIYFIAVLQIGIKGMYYSTIISASTITIILLVNRLFQTKITFSFKKLEKILRYGIFFTPTILLTLIINSSDRYFLSIYSDLKTVGLYALGYKVGMIVSFLIGMPFELVWGYYAFEIEKKENAQKIFARILTYIMFISVLFALSISVLSKEIITIMASPSFIGAYVIIPLIATSMVFQISTNILRIGILIKKKTYYLPIVSAIIAMLNVIFNIALTPKYGMIGAGTANVLSFLFFPLISYLISYRLYPISFEFTRIFRILVTAIGIYVISLFISDYNLWRSIVIKICLITLFPAILMLLGFFEKAEKEHISNAVVMVRKSFIKLIPSQNR